MITATVRFKSKALGRQVTYSAIVPEAANAGPGPYPVLYQLHGASDDHACWLTRSNLVRHAVKYPMLIILPDGELSFWLNLMEGQRYEDYLMEDLWQHVANTYNVRPGRAAIGGLSMGGFGAMRLALRYPDRFASVWSHSGAYWTQAEMAHRSPLLLQAPDAEILETATVAASLPQLPVISFDCGTEDFLLQENRRFHNHLTKLGIAHTYQEHPGAHNWDYWDVHVQEALVQHAEVLGARVPPSLA